MKFTKSFIKTTKSTKEPSVNADLLIRGGFINQLSAGIYTYLPLGKMVLENINNVIREEMNAIDAVEVSMPALHPGENWKKTGRWDSMDDLYRFESYYTKKDYALGATHEEVVTPLVASFVNSYKDLPIYLYQIQTKFRDELRSKSGLLRNREFPMKDLYSFHVNQKDLDAYYERAKEAYHKIYNRLGLSESTYLTYAAGGTFSKYSHEFQTECEAGEDTIYVCEKCRVAVNREIIADQSTCPECGNKELREARAVEVGNIFKLGTKFSEAFNLSFRDEKDKEHLVVMGCYGIGPGRVMGTIVEKFHDKAGVIWPESVSPFDVHLVDLGVDKKEAEKLYLELVKRGTRVLWDDRDETAGVKLSDADLLGIPLRVVISKKTLTEDSVELKKRTSDSVKKIKVKEFLERYAK